MKFTIFTGCYNSSKFINRVFDSLKSQTYQNFEWIVIDDASKDDTVSILTKFKNNNPKLDIKLIALEKNRGVGVNRRSAIKIAQGDLFITWDHDDVQKSNQLEIFKNNFYKFDSHKVGNAFCFCEDQNGKVLGKQFEQGNHVENYFKYYRDYFMTNKVKQEKHVCSKVSVLREYIDYVFPEGVKPNGDMFWGKLALDYDSIFINEPLRIYFIEESNRNNMSSASRSIVADKVFNAKRVWVNNFLHKLKHQPSLVLRLLFSTSFYGLLSNKTIFEILKSTPSIWKKVLLFFSLLPAKLLLLKMKLTNRGL